MRPTTARALAVALCAAVCASASEARATVFQVRTISNRNDTISEFRPRIAGEAVVWQSGSGSFSEVYMWDGKQAVNLSSNGVADENPETDGIHVVWQQRNGAQHDIAVYDLLTQSVSILVDPGDAVEPVVSGTHLWWIQLDAADGEVYPAPDGGQLTGNMLVESDLIADGANLVFVQGDDLHLTPSLSDDFHDIGLWNSELGYFYPLGVADVDDIRPSLAGSTVVWQSGADGSGDIWMADANTGSAGVLVDGSDERNPHTDGKRVVWEHCDVSDCDIYRLNLATPGVITQVTTGTADAGDDVTPQIEGNNIVWVKRLTPGDSEIWVSWNGGAPEPIVATVGNGRDEVAPRLSGDRFVWASCANLGQPSELCDVMLAPEPGVTLLAATALALLAGLATRSAQRAVASAEDGSSR